MSKRLLLPAAGLALAALAGGCSRTQAEAVKPLGTTILIMDFTVPKDYQAEPSKIEGWWFGAHSIFHNPNAGEIFADVLTSEMRSQMDWVSLFSRLHARQYFAQKKTLLSREFPKLKDEEVQALLDQISPISFARELGADKVLVGKIVCAETFFQRTVKYWSSTVEVECSMLEVDSGQVVWRCHEKRHGLLDSVKTVMEEMAKTIAEQMRQEYFLKPQP